ncbi:MAG TPA: DNA polymerase [Candidatus Glassbacteria bacterium]|nr:DNA polymerase [Candidatus Glassbacteria bacterium]
MDKQVIIPKYLQDAINPLSRGYPQKVKLLVFDVETENGKPYFLIFKNGQKVSYFKVTPDDILDIFMKYLIDQTVKNQSNILLAHNLQFDLFAVLCKREREIAKYRNPPPVVHPLGTFTKIVYMKTQFAQLKLKNGAHVKLVDSFNFVKGSLKDISIKLGFKNKKRDRPYFVNEGRAPRNRREWQKLYLYCKSEIKATYELAEFILKIHKEYDCGICVSSSQLASKVFRKHFLKTAIPQVPPYIHQLAIETIHGGRAEVFVKTPIVIPNVKMYDFNSFYPWAMANLPPITSGKWEHVNQFDQDHEGLYRVTGYVHKCKYPIILKNSYNFEYANGERIVGTQITSYELREALRSGEFDAENVNGWLLIPDENAENPFKEYVNHFYEKKNAMAKEDPRFMTNKLLLNCLYGKTYQTIRLTDYQEEPNIVWNERRNKAVRNEVVYRAGGIYLPHLGSWITAMARAKLHQDMHTYKAIDCATDSFKTTMTVPEGEGLGELKLESEGLLLLIKPKLYVMFSKEVQNEVEREGNLREYLKKNLDSMKVGEDIVKFALHGFWGDPKQLLELYVEKGNEYIVDHMVKIKEALRQGKQPRVMESQKRHLKIDWSKEIRPCGLSMNVALKKMELCVGSCFQCAYSIL